MIDVERDGGVGVIRLARPEKANAVTTAMAERLHVICSELNGDRSVRVVVLTGSGATFSAGSDLGTLAEYDSPWAFRARRDYCDAILGLRKPAIAMVNGAAYGGGLELALSCDVRVASATARFAAPEIGLGWIGGGGASQLLPRLVGYGEAALALLTGDPLDAREALRIGLVQRVFPAEEAEERTLALARRIGANAPVALEAMKAALRAALSLPLDEGMRYEEELVAVCMGTRDRDEGIAAWREKRAPTWQGR